MTAENNNQNETDTRVAYLDDLLDSHVGAEELLEDALVKLSSSFNTDLRVILGDSIDVSSLADRYLDIIQGPAVEEERLKTLVGDIPKEHVDKLVECILSYREPFNVIFRASKDFEYLAHYKRDLRILDEERRIFETPRAGTFSSLGYLCGTYIYAWKYALLSFRRDPVGSTVYMIFLAGPIITLGLIVYSIIKGPAERPLPEYKLPDFFVPR